MLPFDLINTIPFTRRKLKQMYRDRAEQIFFKVKPFLNEKDKVIDVGSGTGSVAKMIKDRIGCELSLVDVQYNPMCDLYPVTIYDGKHLPFKDNRFSTALLLTVLHHTHEHRQVLKEVSRVTAKRLIVIEDVFTDLPSRAITFVGDCLVNWEIHSPFTNHTQDDWLRIFNKQGLKVKHTEVFSLRCVGIPFKLALFVLEK